MEVELSMSGESQTPMKVFYSYAHEDESLRDELAKHLAILKRHGLISSWHDRDISAGQEWKDQINDNLNTAQIILLLVSSDFLNSDYCYDIEMVRAMELHQEGAGCVIPIILRPCLWSMASFGKLQALPTGAQPITSAPNRDEAFSDVALGLKTAIENFRPKKPAARPSENVSVGAPLRKELSLSTIWNVPYHRNRNFTGRDELLIELHTVMTSGRPGATIQAICGLGGVGKTQVATEYAYRHAADYTLVWWIRGDNDATVASDYAAMAKPLQLELSEENESDQGRAVEAVKRWLGENTGWLLIFDNLPAAEAVKPYLPQTSGGHVILTSRNPKAKGLATPLPLQVLPVEQSVQFLLARTGQEDSAAAQTLAGELGGLPLALEQAGAYMESTGCTMMDYLEILASHPAAVLAEESPSDYNETVANTWSMAITNVRDQSPGSEDLLNLCAFLGPDAIPLSLFKSGGQNVPESLSGVLKDLFTLNKALGCLKQYSLIEVTQVSR